MHFTAEDETGATTAFECPDTMASRMTWPVSTFCTSHKLNRKSAHVLGELDYDIVAFTHGPHINSGARDAVRGFLKRKDAW